MAFLWLGAAHREEQGWREKKKERNIKKRWEGEAETTERGTAERKEKKLRWIPDLRK